MRAAGYLRVSTDQQVGPERFGLDAQRQQIEAYATAHDLELVTWFEDAGLSGGTLARPGLNAAMDAASRREIDCLLVAKLDRLSRDVGDSIAVRSHLLLSNVQVVSVTEPYDPQDPASTFFMHIITAMGQFEKSRIKDRLSGGRKAKARQGGYAGGRPALGYTATKGGKVLTVEPAGAAAVQRVFALRSEKLSMAAIAAALNSEGITTAEGARWHESQVKRVLDRRPLYEGHYVYADVVATQGQQTRLLEA